ncbi:hypothetical protein BDV25DRAFT_141352 [Aspergillus avenaceus]|uniref:Extracellular membrane protein CFEM domain-containing protein n=1 Tax=Aspergillus avenaceus TaxID=36643 RepID=A0A5N6TR85_ASPAV|nr:hypothetical protein BDV25DRAFT_141352 [Aspergillus avenaceus]
MNLTYLLSVVGLATFAMAQYDDPCGSAKQCIKDCPHSDFFPMIDECDKDKHGNPSCYVNFYCA